MRISILKRLLITACIPVISGCVSMNLISAELGDTDGMSNMGRFSYEGSFGQAQDYKEALRWYRKAATAGDSESQLQVGFMYYFGQGTPRDYQEARMWFRLAADRGLQRQKAKKYLVLTEQKIKEELEGLGSRTAEIKTSINLAKDNKKGWQPVDDHQPQQYQPPQQTTSATKFDEAKSKCAALGFKPKTEKFGSCVMELSK